MLQLLRDYKKFDPAAKSLWEIAFLYPGVKAIFFHRMSHFLYQKKLTFLARFISEIARFLTGIEIHPGATLGKGVIIEHGTGVVIGESTVIGNHVIILHGVTLGARRIDKDREPKRHPTIEDHVILCAGAKIMGPITVGHHARVGANAVVFKNVPPYATVVGAGRVIEYVIDEPLRISG